jgi:hypothetical protein
MYYGKNSTKLNTLPSNGNRDISILKQELLLVYWKAVEVQMAE